MVKRVVSGVFVFVLLFAGPALPDKTEKAYAEFTFARVQFNMNERGAFRRGEAPWHHDYPYSEDFFLGMVSEVTGVHTNVESYQIVQLDSLEIFKYPFLYFSEPGFMELTDKELKNLRAYLNRGGFAFFDDFRGFDLENLQYQLKLVYPDRSMVRLDIEHPIFHGFYEIDSLQMAPPYPDQSGQSPSFWGLKDENDQLIVVANAANDFGEYWEDIDHGSTVLRPAVQAFQFGVNYLIYAMTH